jgi:hypothetical protein
LAGALDDLFDQVRARYAGLAAGSDAKRDLLAHLRSLARWHAEPQDYRAPEPVDFPGELSVAFAVCHPECGAQEFIVEGSTQECQSCGGLMFRAETRQYRLDQT